MASPLVAAPYVDAMLLGEAEDTATAACQGFFDTDDRGDWLDQIEALLGSYVPERTGPVMPIGANASDMHLPARSCIISPDAELSNMFLIEGERGSIACAASA